MVVGFTTTCAISSYHHYSCEFKPRAWWVVLDTTLCDKVCQWLATGRWCSPDSSTKQTDRHFITEILFKVGLNTINQTITLQNKAWYTKVHNSHILCVNGIMLHTCSSCGPISCRTEDVEMTSHMMNVRLTCAQSAVKNMTYKWQIQCPNKIKIWPFTYIYTTRSIWAVNLHWLDNCLLHTVTNHYIAWLVWYLIHA